MNDLIERLRDTAHHCARCKEAADALTALQGELTRTQTLLRVEQAALASFIKEQLEHDDE